MGITTKAAAAADIEEADECGPAWMALSSLVYLVAITAEHLRTYPGEDFYDIGDAEHEIGGMSLPARRMVLIAAVRALAERVRP